MELRSKEDSQTKERKRERARLETEKPEERARKGEKAKTIEQDGRREEEGQSFYWYGAP